jgi:hypothetical protein
MFIHKFAVGDLVRYGPRGPDGTKINKWRAERLGLIQEISERATRPTGPPPGHFTFLYYVLWSDDPKPQMVPEWDLELVPNEN